MTISPWFATAELLSRISKARVQKPDQAAPDKKVAASVQTRSSSRGSLPKSDRA